MKWSETTTEQKIEIIKQAYPDSDKTILSIAQTISSRIGDKVSKSMVTGIYCRHRNKLEKHPLSGRPFTVKSDKEWDNIKSLETKPVVARQNKRIMDEDWRGTCECRWPVSGYKAETIFCCKPIRRDAVYCKDHAARGKGRRGVVEPSFVPRTKKIKRHAFVLRGL